MKGMWMLLVLPLYAATPISINTHGRFLTSPCDILLSVHIVSNPENRWLVLTWESDHLSGESDVQLDGDKAPVIIDRWIPNAPTGDYAVQATLIQTAHRYVAVAQVSVR